MDDIPAFAALPETLRRLAASGVVKHFRSGDRLIHEGEYGDALYIVLEGRLRVFSAGERDREITYGTYGPGEYVGEMSLDGGPRSASVEALQDTVCAMVARATLRRHIAEHPDFAFELLAKVIRRARAATLSAKQLALNDVYGRLRQLLDGSAEARADGSRVIAERLTHREMAHRVGASREMVSRLMKDLEQGGYLESDGAQLHLRRPLPARW